MDVELRPASARDAEWLFALHTAAMRESVESVYGPWVDADQRRMFAARRADEVPHLISADGDPVGTVRLRAAEDGSVEIALLEVHPAAQGRGIGTEVIADIQRRARAAKRPVTLRVMKENRAQSLYRRMGFRVTGATETHLLMEWHPEAPAGT